MAKIIPITEHFQHFVKELKESFWGDLQGEAQRAAKKFFELLSERQRDRYMVDRRYGRSSARQDHRNGYYLRDLSPASGRCACALRAAANAGFCPRSSGVSAAGRRGLPAHPGSVSARDLDAASRTSGRPADRRSGECANRLATDARLGRSGAPVPSGAAGRRVGVLVSGWREFAVRRPSGRQRVQMLVPTGCGATARGNCWLSAQYGRKPKRVGGVARDLYRRGLRARTCCSSSRRLCRIGGGDSDGLPAGAASALLVHKMRNILEHVRNATMTR